MWNTILKESQFPCLSCFRFILPVTVDVSQSYLIGQKKWGLLLREMHGLKFNPRKVRCTCTKTWKTQKTGILAYYEFFWSLVHSDVKKILVKSSLGDLGFNPCQMRLRRQFNCLSLLHFLLLYYKQESIPVGCVPPACQPNVWWPPLAVSSGGWGGYDPRGYDPGGYDPGEGRYGTTRGQNDRHLWKHTFPQIRLRTVNIQTSNKLFLMT